MSGQQKPVKLKTYPVYGYLRGAYGITKSRSRCGACDAVALPMSSSALAAASPFMAAWALAAIASAAAVGLTSQTVKG